MLYLLALAASVSAMSLAGLAYRPSEAMMSTAMANACSFPGQYHIRAFRGQINATSPTKNTLASYSFTFEDQTTGAATVCRWNASSVPTAAPGLTPRYSCEERDVKFIWQDEKRQLTSLERFCRGADGNPTAEVTGTVQLYLTCAGNGTLVSNSTDVTGLYTSLGPVIDPISAD